MILPVFSAVLLLIGIIALAGKKSERKINEQMNAFWERERSANSVRRKPLDDLEDLHIPEEFFGFPSDPDSHDCSEALRILTTLSAILAISELWVTIITAAPSLRTISSMTLNTSMLVL